MDVNKASEAEAASAKVKKAKSDEDSFLIFVIFPAVLVGFCFSVVADCIVGSNTILWILFSVLGAMTFLIAPDNKKIPLIVISIVVCVFSVYMSRPNENELRARKQQQEQQKTTEIPARFRIEECKKDCQNKYGHYTNLSDYYERCIADCYK
jgi:hypothetical protein